MSDLSAEETQALREAAGSHGDRAQGLVSERNFSQPRRLSADRLQHLAQTVGATMQGIGNQMSVPLRSFHKLQVVSVSEVNASTLFQDVEAPFLIQNLLVDGSLGWLVWDERAATAAIEQILSGELNEGQEVEARELSSSEARVLDSLLGLIVRPVAASLNLGAETKGLAQDEEGLKTMRDAGPEADTRRLMLHLVFDGPGGPSDMRLYLPNVEEVGGEQGDRKVDRVPGHLDLVNLEMCVHLGSAKIALRELLALEVGDVIPLHTEVDGEVHLYVEGHSIAQGTWGQVGGSLAMKVHKIDTDPLSAE